MYTLFVSLALVAAVLLVLVVLAQNSKGGGLTSQFGGSGASNLIGVKKTGDLLERLTWALALAIMVFTLSTNFISPGSVATDEMLERAKEQQAAPALKLNNEAAPAETTTPALAPADSAK